MKTLMLGWEFPPFISGGLGTACYGLTKAMNAIGTQVLFVLPRPVESQHTTHVRLLSAAGTPLAGAGSTSASLADGTFRIEELENVAFRTVDIAQLSPYARPEPPKTVVETTKEGRTVQESANAPAVAAATAAASAAVREEAAFRPTQGFVGAGGG